MLASFRICVVGRGVAISCDVWRTWWLIGLPSFILEFEGAAKTKGETLQVLRDCEAVACE